MIEKEYQEALKQFSRIRAVSGVILLLLAYIPFAIFKIIAIMTDAVFSYLLRFICKNTYVWWRGMQISSLDRSLGLYQGELLDRYKTTIPINELICLVREGKDRDV